MQECKHYQTLLCESKLEKYLKETALTYYPLLPGILRMHTMNLCFKQN